MWTPITSLGSKPSSESALLQLPLDMYRILQLLNNC